MIRLWRRQNAVLAAACLLLVQTSALAQAFGTVNGTVTDAKGAGIAKATITVVSTATNVTRTATASKDGVFQINLIPPGTYEVRTEAPGFKTTVQKDVVVQVNTPLTLEMTLEVGEVTETVEVVAGEDIINQTDATIGNTFNETQITQLPIEGRNVVDLLSLQPGVVKTDVDSSQSSGYDDHRSGAVNGARSDQSNVTLDGVDANDQLEGTAFLSVVPVTLDSVQEFRVVTSNANASQGRSAGAQVSLVTKSGSNEFHGSVYEFHRNTIFTANNFFNNAAGRFGPDDAAVLAGEAAVGDQRIPRPKLIRNVFGFSLGGPILKDKFFFFVTYEGRRDAAEETDVREVPLPSFRQGIIRYENNLDPEDPNYNGGISTLTPAGLADLDPLGIGVNPLVVDYWNQFPLPNDTAVGDQLNTLGYRFKAPVKREFNTYIARADYQINTNNVLFWRGNLADNFRNSLPQFPGRVPLYTYLDNSKGMAIGYTSVLTNSITNVFRYGYSRQGLESIGGTNGPFIGFRDFDTLDPYTYTSARNAPVHNFTDDVSWAKGNHTIDFGTNLRFIRINSTSYYNSFPYSRTNTFWLQGAGLNLEPEDLDSSFSSAFRHAAVAQLGLLSYVYVAYNYDRDGNVVPVGEPINRTYGANEYEFYVQDTWKMKPNLTLTAGVRYALFSPPWEVNGLQVAPTTPLADFYAIRVANAAQSIPASAAPDVQFDLAGPANGRKGFYDWDKNNFAPRVSIAWSPGFDKGWLAALTGGPGRTSVRGGFGMFYEHIGAGLANTFDSGGAVGLSTALENPINGYTAATAPRFSGFGFFPPLPQAPPGGFPAQLAPDSFAITFGLDDSIITPVDYSIDFAIARELPGNIALEVAYIGRFARNRLAQSDLANPVNFVDPESGMDWFSAANLLQDYIDRGIAYANAPPIPYFENLYPGLGASQGFTPTQRVYKLARNYAPDWATVQYYLDLYFNTKYGPYTFFDNQYSALSAWRSNENASYNAAQVTLRKRFGHGLLFDVNYTYAKSLDLTSNAERAGQFGATYGTGFIQNAFDPDQNRAVSDFDVTHSVNSNWLWELPIGRDRAYFSGSPGWVDAFVGGWQLSGVFRMTSGFPIGVGNGGYWPTNWNLSGWATAAGEVEGNTTQLEEGPNLFPDPQAGIESFRFTRPGQTGSRNILRGDGIFALDMGLSKEWGMPWEGHKLQFRWEVFNVTNTSRFDVQTINLDLSDQATFGRYTTTLSEPRVMQFGLRYQF
jgi:hypothetical protein